MMKKPTKAAEPEATAEPKGPGNVWADNPQTRKGGSSVFDEGSLTLTPQTPAPLPESAPATPAEEN